MPGIDGPFGRSKNQASSSAASLCAWLRCFRQELIGLRPGPAARNGSTGKCCRQLGISSRSIALIVVLEQATFFCWATGSRLVQLGLAAASAEIRSRQLCFKTGIRFPVSSRDQRSPVWLLIGISPTRSRSFKILFDSRTAVQTSRQASGTLTCSTAAPSESSFRQLG